MRTPLSAIVASTLTVVAAPLQAQNTSAEETVQRARDAAKADRHDDAITAYRAAIALTPEPKREWSLELADQLTWSKRLDEAIRLYREVAQSEDKDLERRARVGLARALSWDGQHKQSVSEYDRALAIDPGATDVRLARAQVLAWADRLDNSIKAYDEILQTTPENFEAQRGKARVLSWRGRQREAVKEAMALLQRKPDDTEAAIILAESLDWMGRPDRALAALRGAGSDSRIAALRSALELRNRPEARADFRVFDQSDNLEIIDLAFDLRVPLASGRGVAGIRYSRADYRPDGKAERQIIVQKPQLYAGFRLNDALELNGAVSIDVIDPAGAGKDRSRFAFETYATVRPNDIVRIDIGASRWTFDSEETLLNALTATQIGASVDVRPDQRAYLSGRVSRTTFSDGNRRTWWQGEASYRIVNRPNIMLGYRYTSFDFKTPGQRGYYNPDRFSNHEILIRGSGQFSPRLFWDVRLIGGYETERPGGSRPTINTGFSLARQFGSRFVIETGYDFSSSRSFATGGFERGIARLTLRAKF